MSGCLHQYDMSNFKRCKVQKLACDPRWIAELEEGAELEGAAATRRPGRKRKRGGAPGRKDKWLREKEGEEQQEVEATGGKSEL